tara:strand:+ start:32 stop:469 length:438 start_codon:yes stop_codon:yes gene_type:complete
MSQFYNLNPDPKANHIFTQLNQPSKVVGARSVISDPATGSIGNIILVSDSKLFGDQGGASSPENRIFIMNTIDYLLGDSELISLRSREVTDRPLLSDADGVNNQMRLTWKIVNMLFPSFLIIILGVYIMRYNKRRSEKLKLSYHE